MDFLIPNDPESYRALYNGGEESGLSTGWPEMDKFWRIKKGQLNILTGVPSHGKSEFMDALAINMARKHSWRTLFYSPENYPIELHKSKLVEKKIEKPFFGTHRMGWEEAELGLKWAEQFFWWIDPYFNEDLTLDHTLNLFEEQKKEGMDMVVIDPWNEIEVTKKSNESEHDFIGSSLKKCRLFARKHELAFFILAHPRKMELNSSGKPGKPRPYDISGSSHWFNKPDNCFAIYRDREKECVEFFIDKIKFKQFGHPGKVNFTWNGRKGGLYEPYEARF